MVATNSKFTTQRRAAIIEAVAKGHSLTSAAAFGGISKQTLFSWLAKAEKQPDGQYEQFARDLALASAQAADIAVGAIKAAMPDDWRAAMEFLARRFPDDWSKAERHEVSGPKGEPIKIEVKWPTTGPPAG